MKRRLPRLWPSSLGGRFALLLIAALAAAELTTFFISRNREQEIVEEIAHGKVIGEAATLARLLDMYPMSDEGRLASSFGARLTCVTVSWTPPSLRSMSQPEQKLADLLSATLRGLNTGLPSAAIDPKGVTGGDCPNPPPNFAPESNLSPLPILNLSDYVTVEMVIPLRDGRWATMRTAIHRPPAWPVPVIISFVLSSACILLAAIVSVRAQTHSLRALADASDRFGRGETIPPLPTDGPSEVASAARAFNTMQASLGQVLRDRMRLLAAVSHDLRTPLTALRLKAEFIEDEVMRDDIVATLDELAAICEATLAFTRAEAQTEAARPVDLPTLIADVAETFHVMGQKVSVREHSAVTYICRPVALKRALRNLVENAVRYAGGATIRLESGSEGVKIAVEDVGPGLPADQIEEAFKPFVRLENSRNAETGGIGLGLAIARGIARDHAGELKLANLSGGGLRAEIALPRQTKSLNRKS